MNLVDVRYDHPRLYWCSVVCAGSLAVLMMFVLLPKNSFFEAVGVSELQRRGEALKNAAYWYGRSVIHASSEGLAFDVLYGNVVRFADGSVVTSIPQDDKFKEVNLVFADVVVNAPEAAHAAVREARFKDARFEIYDQDKAVVWIEGKPLNVALIEIGAAAPDPNPPTNIVDLAFASYYWTKFKGDSP